MLRARWQSAASFARLLAWGEVSSSSSFCEPQTKPHKKLIKCFCEPRVSANTPFPNQRRGATFARLRMEAQLYCLRAAATRLTGKYWAAPYASSLLAPRLPPPTCARPVSGVGLGPHCYTASRLWFPGPRPLPVFRSAICDCLSINVSGLCFRCARWEDTAAAV